MKARRSFCGTGRRIAVLSVLLGSACAGAASGCGGRTLGGGSTVSVESVCRQLSNSDCGAVDYQDCVDEGTSYAEEARDAGCDSEWRAVLVCLADNPPKCSDYSYESSVDDSCRTENRDLLSCTIGGGYGY